MGPALSPLSLPKFRARVQVVFERYFPSLLVWSGWVDGGGAGQQEEEEEQEGVKAGAGSCGRCVVPGMWVTQPTGRGAAQAAAAPEGAGPGPAGSQTQSRRTGPGEESQSACLRVGAWSAPHRTLSSPVQAGGPWPASGSLACLSWRGSWLMQLCGMRRAGFAARNPKNPGLSRPQE